MSTVERYRFDKRTQEIMEHMAIPFAVYQFIDKRVATIALSAGFCRLFGYSDLAGAYYDMDHDMYKAVHPDDAARIADAALRFAMEGGRYEVVYRSKALASDGYRTIHATGEHVMIEEGVRLAYVWYVDEGPYEETEEGTGLRHAMNKALHEESILKANQYDYLTGLPSMAYFFELAEAARYHYVKDGKEPVFLYMDFCGMKFFNTKNGFAEGDKLLLAFSGLLKLTFSNENSCRIGADHFAAFTTADGLEEKLTRFLEDSRKLNGGDSLPVHIGIYSNGLDPVPVSTACDRAKLACDAIKNAVSSAFNYYSSALKDDAVKRQYILSNLDRAIREHWIIVYYQPIVRTVSGHVCDEEALARWIDPERGFLSPADFIPCLEDSGLIYKLDLYVLEQVLKKMKYQKEAGLSIVPHSINLSRADFDSCDIVEEVRRRVDASGLGRNMITVEITESTLGRDFEFMKEQVDRFQSLGFPVWMDDFGSGYASLDALQSIKFDLLKFDMSFMRKLDEGENGKIILTELMRMAYCLGMDTVCEGVEKEEQVKFLFEIGCSKIQGYYYCKPIPLDEIMERYETGRQIGYENPEQSKYYETIGRLNLYDLSVMNKGEGELRNAFNTVPMGLVEVRGDTTRFVRSNESYRRFIKRFFHVDLSFEGSAFAPYDNSFMANVVKTCCEKGVPSFYNEQMPDGSVVHSFARRVGIDPVTGSIAVVVAVLSITAPDAGATYADIARALAADYYNIYYVDLDTDRFIEYTSPVGKEELALERHGENFFEALPKDTMTRVYEEDREAVLAGLSKQRIIDELDRQGLYTLTFRIVENASPLYVNMKITRMQGGNRIILGISIIDSQMKQQEEEKKLRMEKASLGRIAALSPNYIVLYTVDLVSGHYTQYNASKEYEGFGLAKQGDDFFTDVILDAPKAIAPEDMERHLRVLTKENILRSIEENGSFIYNYRLLLNGKAVPVSLRATLVDESDGRKLILGVTNDEEEYRRRLEKAYKNVNRKATMYTHIAHALARGYTDLFYVNMESNELVEFHTDDEHGVLSEVRHSADFFEDCERDAKTGIHPDDQEKFLHAMNRDFLRKALDENKVFELTYRRVKGGDPFYVQMKVTRMEDDKRFAVIAVQDIDEQVRHREEEERIQEERIVYARLHALTGNYIVVYVVDPETDHYREFSATDDYTEGFEQAKTGENFFEKVREAARQYNDPEDLPRFLTAFTKEQVMAEIARSGIFTLGYRLLMDGRPVHCQMKAAIVEEKEGPRLIVGLNDIDVQVRQEEEYGRRLAQAQAEASIDALTGVRNKHAYMVMEAQMDRRIANHRQPPFAMMMLDVNDLKKINDTAGHQAGDRYLRDACKIICDIFKHSPVYRIGGDEFAVIAQGSDYACIEDRFEKVSAHNAEALQNGGILIACGMARFEDDARVADVLERADRNMYENKNALKAAYHTSTE